MTVVCLFCLLTVEPRFFCGLMERGNCRLHANFYGQVLTPPALSECSHRRFASVFSGRGGALLCSPVAKREAGMTDQQFKTIVAHLQVMIAILGVMAGVCWP
jgi:hypothetical protein